MIMVGGKCTGDLETSCLVWGMSVLTFGWPPKKRCGGVSLDGKELDMWRWRQRAPRQTVIIHHAATYVVSFAETN